MNPVFVVLITVVVVGIICGGWYLSYLIGKKAAESKMRCGNRIPYGAKVHDYSSGRVREGSDTD